MSSGWTASFNSIHASKIIRERFFAAHFANLRRFFAQTGVLALSKPHFQPLTASPVTTKVCAEQVSNRSGLTSSSVSYPQSGCRLIIGYRRTFYRLVVNAVVLSDVDDLAQPYDGQVKDSTQERRRVRRKERAQLSNRGSRRSYSHRVHF